MATSRVSICSKLLTTPSRIFDFNAPFCNFIPERYNVAFCIAREDSHQRLLFVNQPRGRDHRSSLKPASAIGSGFETTMEDLKGSTLTLKKAEIAVESQDADKIKLRVDLTGAETQKAFDMILSNLARSAPPLPGFRLQKGGKKSMVPKNLLLNLIGKDRVMRFVIREIVTSAVANYVEKENLTVRNDKITTTQTEEELKESFLPGNEFGFNVGFELRHEENETTTNDS